jgi:hypothetical protein
MALEADTGRVTALQPARFSLRGLMLGLVAFGLVGLATELTFLEHYEEASMAIPFAAIVAALGAVLWLAFSPSAMAVRVARIVMVLFVAVGALGVVLHYQGSLEFQVDMDPTASASQLFWKVMHMKAPPTLAPGAMVQLGLLGLLITYRHPALTSRGQASSKGESS